jgi:SAM-dependent methyltransferase
MRIPSPLEFLDASLYRRAARKIGNIVRHTIVGGSSNYESRLRSEQDAYKDCLDVNNLPEIFHYWSNKYLGPKIAQFGFNHPDEFFALYLQRAADRGVHSPPRFVSIGAGNCDTEVRVAKLLRNRGLGSFTIECIDINSAMLERGRQMAEGEGVSPFIVTTRADFNRWRPDRAYCAVVANQSLHHVLKLEHLLASISEALRPGGLFIAFDMIGRNGHQRWPEALEIVQEYWKELPHSYRFNQQLRRFEETFLDWDCSAEGFEGIRAQDILPLLVERFEFDLFVPFANVIDPFIDRAFGHNFDPRGEWDRAFIDRVHARDEYELRRGTIKPTHMFAVACVGRKGESVSLDGMTPAGSIRIP